MNEKKRNIAILSSCLTRGGAERAAGELSVHLADKANVFLFLLEDKEITYGYSGTIIQLKFEKYYNSLKNKYGGLIAKFAYLLTIRDIKKLKEKNNIDVCVSFLEILNIMNLLSRNKEEIFLSVRNNRSLQKNSKLLKFENWFIKHFYKKATGIVALSYGVAEDLKNNFSIPVEKISTIYNFYDIQGIIKKSNDALPKDVQNIFYNNRVLLSMGRLVPQKNFIGLINAVEPVLNEYIDVVLVILGRGELKDDLEKIIREKKLTKKIYLIDYLSNPMPLIKNSNIFIMNSYFEGLCNSIVESMICKTITISTDCKFGPREMIAGMRSYENEIKSYVVCERGILVALDDVYAMTTAIFYALNNMNSLKTCKINSSRFFNDKFNEKIEKQWLELLKVE